MVRGPWSKHLGPWSTDLEPRSEDSVSRFKLRGSRLVDAGLGVTWDGCEIWVELGRGVGRVLAVFACHTCGGDGLVEVVGSDIV